ncbi:putative ABC transporter, permease protein [Actinorhabdospora filicis]|uniref:ABC transporter, permease protein n=1 Tax=Actinorhabdospora filicis TaxID=1785913 RepID=A0A9W6WCI1_9ACTN|nr:MFS transporter [Actinorhabdospora filicis]GLZ81664.1 putative ABC transporter, permease protein [Actinorhabdospora filicis]
MRGFASFSPAARLLMVNQFGINLGFYILMPFLAAHLAGLGVPAAVAGLVLGLRNLTQQGMFLPGGMLADRFGGKPLIVAGCVLRTGGFALLGLATALPWQLAGAVATGLAGALFNPAVRGLLAAEAGERRVEAFALFNVFYQAGMLAGPVAGLALSMLDFRVASLAAAGVFAVLAVWQALALPAREERGPARPVAEGLRALRRSGGLMRFATAMAAAYLLSFQVYLLLPLTLRAAMPERAALLTAGMFALTGAVTIAGQVRLTAALKRRLAPGRAVAFGVAGLAASFLIVPIGLTIGPMWTVAAVLFTAAGITVATMVAFPFEMDIVIARAPEGLAATFYGAYSTVAGIGITAGNLLTGALADATGPPVPWLVLAGIGGLAALALFRAAGRDGRTRARPASVAAAQARP